MLAAAGALQGISTLIGAVGASQAQQHQAAQAKRAAQVGRIQADQVDTAYREELTSTLNNIRAIRAATGAEADSPTALAIEGKNTATSDRNRTRDVANRRMQANQDESDAAFYRQSARMSLFGGAASSLPKFFGA